jgi:hypothetical protein
MPRGAIASAAVALLLLLAGRGNVGTAEEPGSGRFIRGDANLDARVSIADLFSILRYIGLGANLSCRAAADVDDSGAVNLTDAIYLLGSVFYRHSAPPEPFASPGVDPTPDGTGCWRGLDLRDMPQQPPGQGGGGGDEEAGDGCGDDEGGGDLEFIHFRGPLLVAPGESSLRVPLYYRSAGGVEGLTVSLHAPPRWLRLERLQFAPAILESKPYWVHEYSLNQYEGYLSSSLAMSLAPPFRTLPATESAIIATLEFSVRADAPVGTRIPIRFIDTPGEDSLPPIRNELSRQGKSQIVPLCGLVVEVVPPHGLFIRGDANVDRAVNLLDAVLVLRHLFAAGEGVGLPCPDAADFDDDGTIQLSDPIGMVNYLFRRGEAPAYPFPLAGRDSAKPDSLDCPRD